MNKNFEISYARGLAPVVGLIVIWEAAARLDLFPGDVLVPAFSAVVLEIREMLFGDILIPHLISSLLRVLAGFFAGAVCGILLGIWMGWSPYVRQWFRPIVSLLYPIPALGWLPLLMLWVGVNELLPIAIIFICSFFPILYNTVTGIRQVSSDYIDAARILGASDSYILRRVVVPMALPNIFTGLRLEAGMAWKVVIAAEMVAIPTGIGALMMRAENLMRMDMILVCLMVLSVMCLAFERFFSFLEQKATGAWR
jgi:NitT/TauT family transport system permease protein